MNKASSKKVVKELYGTMFEIKTDVRGGKEVLITDDLSKAADIITLENVRRCPHCQSDKCLANLRGQTFVFPEYFRYVHGSHVRYLDIATCKSFGRDFIIAISIRFMPKGKEKCIWCGSFNIARISNINEVRRSFFKISKIEKYRWLVWGESGEDEFTHSHLKGMTFNEFNLFRFKKPMICKHCNRIFGFEPDWEESWSVFNKLVHAVRFKELIEYLTKLSIKPNSIMKKGKCPFCSCEVDCENWIPDVLPWSDESPGFSIMKYECGRCSKEFFDVYDEFNT